MNTNFEEAGYKIRLTPFHHIRRPRMCGARGGGGVISFQPNDMFFSKSLQRCAPTRWWHIWIRYALILPVDPLRSSYGDTSSITVSIPPNKYFNITITEYNGYGNTSVTVISEPILNREDHWLNRSCEDLFLLGTFDVVGVYVNTSSPTGLVCFFNPGSLVT